MKPRTSRLKSLAELARLIPVDTRRIRDCRKAVVKGEGPDDAMVKCTAGRRLGKAASTLKAKTVIHGYMSQSCQDCPDWEPE